MVHSMFVQMCLARVRRTKEFDETRV